MTQTQTLSIESLHAHPLNSNVMSADKYAKLQAHIQRTGHYPPVIVRPHENGYQILDGHHRVQVLRAMNVQDVRCDVWPVDDEEALTLLATLNRLEGHDDARLRSRLLHELAQCLDRKTLLDRLPDDVERVDHLLALSKPADEPRPAAPSCELPVAVHFFLRPDDAATLKACLKQQGGTREEALMKLVASCDHVHA